VSHRTPLQKRRPCSPRADVRVGRLGDSSASSTIGMSHGEEHGTARVRSDHTFRGYGGCTQTPLKGAARIHGEGNSWSLETRDSPRPNPVPTSPSEVPQPSGRPPLLRRASTARKVNRVRARPVESDTESAARIAIVIRRGHPAHKIIGAARAREQKDTATTASGRQRAWPLPRRAAPHVGLKAGTGRSLGKSSQHRSWNWYEGGSINVGEQSSHVQGTHGAQRYR